MLKITNLLKNFDGESSVCFYITDLKKLVRPKNISGVLICERLFSELSRLIDTENIGIISSSRNTKLCSFKTQNSTNHRYARMSNELEAQIRKIWRGKSEITEKG